MYQVLVIIASLGMLAARKYLNFALALSMQADHHCSIMAAILLERANESRIRTVDP